MTIDDQLRELAPQVLSLLLRRYRDFTAAEDAVQEALLAASQQWPRDGMPDNPRAWLVQVASRRMADAVRSDAARRNREQTALAQPGYWALSPGAAIEPRHDDALVLLLMCCHPSLTESSAIALTLRAVGGLTTAEIARAFLVPESTMAQRISRAKQTIQQSGTPFRLPLASERSERLNAVLHVLYLIFNEGYTSGGPQLQRSDLAQEAIRLTRLVYTMLPHDPEVAGLLALMLLTDARRAARSGSQGELIPLDEQDRSLWDHAAIGEGVALVSAALPKGAVGPYQLQAAIAAVHDEAECAEDTDWPQILALYEVLLRIANNPMVALNRAVAVAMVRGPAAGLALLDGIELQQHHRLHAVRAHLLERAGDAAGAIASFEQAAQLTTSLPERNYLLSRAASLRK